MLSRFTGRVPVDSTAWRGLHAAAATWKMKSAVAALLAGALLGAAVLLAGPLLVLLGVVGIIAALAAFRHPEILIVAVLALASQLVPSRFNIFLDLFVARFQVSDLLLGWLLLVTVLRVVMERRFPFRSTPLDLPLVLFYTAALGGLATAVVGFGVNFNNATYEARTLAYYLILFPITNLVRTRRQLVRLAAGTIAVAVLMTGSMLLQTAVQPAFLADDWAVQGSGRVVRNFHPGFSAVYVGLLMVIGYVALQKPGTPHQTLGRRWLLWGMMLLMLSALFSTLARNLLVASVVSLGLMALVLGEHERMKLARNLGGLAASLVLLFALLAVVAEAPVLAQYASAYGDRLERMFSGEILSREENLFSRWEEMTFAFSRLREHPILGLGLYNPYRPAFYRGEAVTLRHFIHNAYVGMWLKTGLPGLISFLWLSAAFVRYGFRRWKSVSDPLLRGVALGSVVAYVGLLFTNFVAPSFVQPGSLAIMGVTLGLTASILLLDGGENQAYVEGESA
jgi:O-antigen ligase